MKIHGQIRIIPVADHPEPLEFLPLDINPLLGEAAALLAQLDDRNIILLQPLLPVLFLDLPLDRQAMAIPAGHVAGILAHHLLRPDHHVLEDLVQRMADMKVAIGIGRAVMKNEGGAAGPSSQLAIDVDLLPAGEPFRLTLRQSGPHLERRVGKQERVPVVDRFGGHLVVNIHSRTLRVNCRQFQ